MIKTEETEKEKTKMPRRTMTEEEIEGHAESVRRAVSSVHSLKGRELELLKFTFSHAPNPTHILGMAQQAIQDIAAQRTEDLRISDAAWAYQLVTRLFEFVQAQTKPKTKTA